MLQTLQQTGQPAPGAGAFAFTPLEANSTLFDPFLAAQRTVGSALAAQNDCIEVTGAQAVDFVSTQTIASPTSDADATVNHLTTIAAASQSTTVTIELVGGNLVSQGIPSASVTGMPATAIPFTPDAQTAQWIAAIELHAIQFTAGQNPAADIKNRLLGLPTNAQLLADSIWDFTILNLAAPPEDMRELRAAFGIYGSLPIIEIDFDAGYILIDSITGQAAGPFTDDQPFDAVQLLLNHPQYQPGTAATTLVAASGCQAAVGRDRWRTQPPPGYVPRPTQLVPCPTQQNPAQVCPAGPTYMPPQIPQDWPEILYPHRIQYPGYIPPYGNPGMPMETPQTTPWRRNPGLEGHPTDWVCVSTGPSGSYEICTTITLLCPTSGPCIMRLITCVFNGPNGNPPNKQGTPPNPAQDWPQQQIPLIFNPQNSNRCIDRFFY